MKRLQLYIPISSLPNICRVCLLHCDELTSIDEIHLAYSYRNGLEEELSARDVFRKYCNIQIEREDSKPNNLCQICINMVCQAYNVFEQFVESNDILNNLIKQHKVEEKSIGSCTENLPQLSLENEHSQDETTIVLQDPETENISDSESSDKDTAFSHDIYEGVKANCEQSPKRTVLCDNYEMAEGYSKEEAEFIMLVPDHQKVNPEKTCQVFDSSNIESIHDGDDRSPISSDEEYFVESADCGTQDLPIEAGAVWDHTYSHSNGETLVQVEEVDSALTTEKLVNERKDNFQCWICGLVLKGAQNCKRHLETHQKTRHTHAHLCEFCARGFERAAALRAHVLKMHKKGDTKKPLQVYTCEFCPKTFSRRAARFMHRISHPECKNIQCLFCDKICANAEEYREHKRKDHRAFVCDICSKGFPNQISLTNHKYLHNVDYRCTYCDASFKTRQSHQIHEYSHTGEKPFQCEYCDKQFKQQAHMKQHIECTHTEKRFKCELCNKAFVFRNTYRNHMRMHTGKKPFVCPYCAKRFRATSVRHKHVRRAHPERMEDFLVFKKTHQEQEVKLADCQTDDPNDMFIETGQESEDIDKICSYNMFSQEKTSAGEDDDYITD